MTLKEEDDIVKLMEDSHLRKLAKILLNQEEALMGAINTESERAEYIEECNDAYDKVISLLDKCNEFNSKSKQGSEKNTSTDIPKDTNEPLKHAIDTIMELVRWFLPKGWTGLDENLAYETNYAYDRFIHLRNKYNGVNHKGDNKQETETAIAHIANDIQDYIKYAINISLQCIKNCRLRKRWVSKIEAHFETLVQELEDLNSRKLLTDVYSLAENVSLYKQCMLDLASNCGTGSAQFNSEAYTTLLQKKQIQFSDMAKRKMTELGFAGEFDRLSDSQQLEVCRGIVNESGRAHMVDIELANRKSGLTETGSCFVASHHLLVEFIFGKEVKNIRDLTQPTFHGLQMPDGFALACRIAYAN